MSPLDNTSFMHSLYSLYKAQDGNVYLLKVYVEEALSKNGDVIFSRAYELKDIEKVANITNGVLSQTGGLTEVIIATEYSISDLYKFVKRFDKDFVPAPEVLLKGITSRDAFVVLMDVNTTAICNLVEAVQLWNEVNDESFDGIIVPTETVAFYPEQIKSATDNVGTFDANNPDIRYSFRNSKSGKANDALICYDDELSEYIKQNGDYIVETFDDLTKIINLAFDNKKFKATAYFGMISESTLKKIKNSVENLPKEFKETLFKKGRDYSVAVTMDSIRHIVDEKKLTREDVLNYLDRLADTILEFDSYAFDFYRQGKNTIPGLLFKKQFSDGTLISFDFISKKKIVFSCSQYILILLITKKEGC